MTCRDDDVRLGEIWSFGLLLLGADKALARVSQTFFDSDGFHGAGVRNGGWRLDRFVEPKPLPEMKAASERLHAELSLAPAFLCIRARR